MRGLTSAGRISPMDFKHTDREMETTIILAKLNTYPFS
jgi:hypothetical protein